MRKSYRSTTQPWKRKEEGLPSVLLQDLTETDLPPDAERNLESLISKAKLAVAARTITTTHCLNVANYHTIPNEFIHNKLIDASADGFFDSRFDQLKKKALSEGDHVEELAYIVGYHRSPFERVP